MSKQSNLSIIAVLLGLSVASPVLASIRNTNPVGTPVSFKSNVVVAGSAVRADSLIKTSDENTRKELENIQIGNIPNPLGELVLDKETISQKLGSLAESVDIPENVVIKRLGSILKSDEIKARIAEYCQSESEDELTFDFSRLASTIVLPGNIISWNISSNSNNELGMRLFALDAETEGGPFRQLVQVSVSKTIQAAKLCQLVKPGEVVTEDMVEPYEVIIKNEKNNTAVPYKDVIGMTLDRFKSAGTIIRNSDVSNKGEDKKTAKAKVKKVNSGVRTANALTMLGTTSAKKAIEDDWLIKPGESVEFRVNSGALSLSIPAKAVQGGNNGDEIELINLKNKRRISGVITDKGVVEYAQK